MRVSHAMTCNISVGGVAYLKRGALFLNQRKSFKSGIKALNLFKTPKVFLVYLQLELFNILRKDLL